MATGYTQQIINGEVKTPKEFLHLCLRNFGVCYSMRDEPLNSQRDYTESIKKWNQSSIDYHINALENAKKEYERITNLSDDDLYKRYVKEFTNNRKYCQKELDNIMNHNATYKLFYDAIKNWNCSAEFNNIKDFALNQIDISKDSGDYYKDVLSQEMLTKEEFISNNKYKEELLKNAKQGIDYHQEQLDNTIKKMNDELTFYENFKKEIENL